MTGELHIPPASLSKTFIGFSLSVCLSSDCGHDFVHACCKKWVHEFFWKFVLSFTYYLEICTWNFHIDWIPVILDLNNENVLFLKLNYVCPIWFTIHANVHSVNGGRGIGVQIHCTGFTKYYAPPPPPFFFIVMHFVFWFTIFYSNWNCAMFEYLIFYYPLFIMFRVRDYMRNEMRSRCTNFLILSTRSSAIYLTKKTWEHIGDPWHKLSGCIEMTYCKFWILLGGCKYKIYNMHLLCIYTHLGDNSFSHCVPEKKE